MSGAEKARSARIRRCAKPPPVSVQRQVRVEAGLPGTPASRIRKTQLRAGGITARTFDREAAGIGVRRETLATA